MNARQRISFCAALLLLSVLALAPAWAAAPAPSAEMPEPAAAAPASDVFGASVLSPAADCQPPKVAAGSLDPTQKCGACSHDGCKLNWIGVECGSNPGGTKYCEPIGGTCSVGGGAICRCQNP